MSNATRLWVSLLEHTPYTKGNDPVTIHDPFLFKKLSLDLAYYYSDKKNRKYHGTSNFGSLVFIAAFSGRFWDAL